jgi:hypothetical protein
MPRISHTVNMIQNYAQNVHAILYSAVYPYHNTVSICLNYYILIKYDLNDC